MYLHTPVNNVEMMAPETAGVSEVLSSLILQEVRGVVDCYKAGIKSSASVWPGDRSSICTTVLL